jgi:hypothetical protein
MELVKAATQVFGIAATYGAIVPAPDDKGL